MGCFLSLVVRREEQTAFMTQTVKVQTFTGLVQMSNDKEVASGASGGEKNVSTVELKV